jgi:aryl-alcohol dehydrogenase-like predicted oxidoreductase
VRAKERQLQYTTLGKTGLNVSVAGLGCGGFSRLGIPGGKTEDEAARLILEAVDMGINLLDTAPAYGTEAAVGKALKSMPRPSVVVATKAFVHRNNTWFTPEQVVASLDNSLRLMGTDYVDLFQLHGIMPDEYAYSLEKIGPALLEQKAKGKIRHIGITEQPVDDFTHETLVRATQDDIWEVFMVAFHMMHQSARKALFPLTRKKRIGTLLMFAVRSIFARPERVVAALRDAAAQGKVDKSLGESAEPLGFLIHDSGAANITEAAYRFARHEPGVDVVLFGTGDAGHLRANVASLLRPPLPEADRAKLARLFGQLTGVGMDSAPMQIK